MERVTGIGGVFFRAQDPKTLADWYQRSLGLAPHDGYVWFDWLEPQAPHRQAMTTWALFAKDTSYFDPIGGPKPETPQATMFNYRVTNLAAMLDQLRKAGARVDEKTESSEFGKFGWATDPEGNRFELWEPPATLPGVEKIELTPKKPAKKAARKARPAAKKTKRTATKRRTTKRG